ncbi:hypothetical protein CTI12_AA179440 [Artemisia annua]|uniref:Protein kinase domain-containing protein n=1 Tax=Artemisia annua TaxID=35608 RepID=A0A2U1P9E3_ARTAN|nr:hypothetical protein CTI12_AA179440 [Artemisia annua]
MSSPKDEFAHLRIPLEMIQSATNNFDEKNVKSTGGIGNRYTGQLLWSGELINIIARRLNKDLEDGEQMFWMEISMLSSLKHINLVSLVGFSDENGEKIIITRHDTRGSLDNYLSDPMSLTWVRRLEICVGLAHALSYIHYDEQRDFSVIHRYICSATVVLNDVWEPKLCDFECSMKIEASQRHHSFHTNKLHYQDGKSVIDQDNKNLASLAIFHYREKKLDDIIDPDLRKQMDPQSLNIFAETLYDCLNKERSQRRNIDEIVIRLEKALELQLGNYNNSIADVRSPFKHKKFQHLKIELQAIKSATNDFNVSHRIGRGGFGEVYKGELVHSKGKSVVALKRLNRAFGQGDPEFWKEVIMLSQYRHDNIVSLLGFCDDCGEKILIYEYASKKSLDLYVNDKDLTWVQRLEICIGAARGLAYLHNPGQTQQRVLHRDIKSSNILLDENRNARIADLGLSKFGPANQQYSFLVSNAVGTFGYCDPLYIETGFLTKESDVYSFGVVLFEMLCGRLCIRYNQDKPLTILVRECYKQKTINDIVYANIKDEINPHSLKAFTTVAYQCLKREADQRPFMTKVVKVLETALSLQSVAGIFFSTGGRAMSLFWHESAVRLADSIAYDHQQKADIYDRLDTATALRQELLHAQSLQPVSADGSSRILFVLLETNLLMFQEDFHLYISIRLKMPPKPLKQQMEQHWEINGQILRVAYAKSILGPGSGASSFDHIHINVAIIFCLDMKGPCYQICTLTHTSVEVKGKSLAMTMRMRTTRMVITHLMSVAGIFFSTGGRAMSLFWNEDIFFDFLLESFSSYCGDGGVYVEGIEFRAIDEVKHEEIGKLKEVQQVLKSNFNMDLVQQLPSNFEEIFNTSRNYDELFWLGEVNEKKILVLSAKAVLYKFSNVDLFTSKPLAESRFQEVIELLPQQVFHLNCTIKSQMLSQDSEYVCYLVFKLSENCQGLHCPVKVRDVLHKENNEVEFVYFITPSALNINGITRVPKQREDGWMEIQVWKFNSAHEFKDGSFSMDMKFTSHEGPMSGLIVCGLEFRPL